MAKRKQSTEQRDAAPAETIAPSMRRVLLEAMAAKVANGIKQLEVGKKTIPDWYTVTLALKTVCEQLRIEDRLEAGPAYLPDSAKRKPEEHDVDSENPLANIKLVRRA